MSEEKTVSRRKKTETPVSDKPKTQKTTAGSKGRTADPAVSKTRKTAGETEIKAPDKPNKERVTKTASVKKAMVKTGPKVAPVQKPVVKADPGAGASLKPKTTARAKKPAKPTGSELAELVVAAAAEHKPIDPVLLNLSGLSSVADWFFVVSADNPRQMEAIAEKIIRRARERGVRPLGREGLGRGVNSPWVLVDLGDVVVHIFNLEARGLYDLEGLWIDALRHPVKT